jgi:hypothetical protein
MGLYLFFMLPGVWSSHPKKKTIEPFCRSCQSFLFPSLPFLIRFHCQNVSHKSDVSNEGFLSNGGNGSYPGRKKSERIGRGSIGRNQNQNYKCEICFQTEMEIGFLSLSLSLCAVSLVVVFFGLS